MRKRLLLAAQLCLFATPVFAQDAPPGISSRLPEYQTFGKAASPQDAQAIRDLMQRFSEARSRGDARATAAAFADDVEWTNAFGDVVRGSDNLQKFLGWLFSMDEPGTTRGEAVNYRPISIRYVGDDVAILHGMTISTRGESRSGQGARHVHLTFVLAKTNKEWRIVHQQITDARD